MSTDVESRLRCHRCRKVIAFNDQYADVQYPPNGRGVSRPPVAYHLKCLPPDHVQTVSRVAPGTSGRSD